MSDCAAVASDNVGDHPVSWETSSCIVLRDVADLDSEQGDQNASADEEHDSDTESSSTGVSPCFPFDVMRVIKQRALQMLLDGSRPITSTRTGKLGGEPEPLCRFGTTVFTDTRIVRKGGHGLDSGCDIHTLTSIIDGSYVVLQEVAQVIFFFQGSLRLDVLPICKEHPPIFYYSDYSELEDFSSSTVVEYALAGLEGEFMAHIWHACISWLCTTILIGDLPDPESMVDQNTKLQHWDIEMRDTDLELIFAVLRPGVDIDRVMEEKWRNWAKILAIQLVDDLYVFHFAQTPSAMLDNHIIVRFRAASMREALQESLHVHIEEIPVGGELSSLLLSM